MSSWFNIQIGDFTGKYTSLAVEEISYPYCDSEGNVLRKVSGSFTKGHFINDSNGTIHDKALRLVKGKAHLGVKGRKKEFSKEEFQEVDKGSSEDLLIEKEFLLDSEELYNHLLETQKEISMISHFGNGYKTYRVYVTPSPNYKGFCIMKCGRKNKSEILKTIIQEREELKDLQNKLKSVELMLSKVNNNPEDLLI